MIVANPCLIIISYPLVDFCILCAITDKVYPKANDSVYFLSLSIGDIALLFDQDCTRSFVLVQCTWPPQPPSFYPWHIYHQHKHQLYIFICFHRYIIITIICCIGIWLSFLVVFSCIKHLGSTHITKYLGFHSKQWNYLVVSKQSFLSVTNMCKILSVFSSTKSNCCSSYN